MLIDMPLVKYIETFSSRITDTKEQKETKTILK